jgi:multidrug efflux pump
LTAAAASLALIPIAREIFWGPMAYAMMGGIIVGTLLTLLFLPALYVAWFRIKAPGPTDNDNPVVPELQTSLLPDAVHQPEMANA